MRTGYCGAFPWPLLLLQQSTWAALKVSVPPSPFRALPFSDVWLPCTFSDSARPIILQGLSVTWKRGDQVLAKYPDKFKPTRPGAAMSTELLQAGNASLLLPQLQDTDAGVYSCAVIFTPEKTEGSFELKLEAKPQIALGSPKLQLAKRAEVTCTASGFYPGDISVEWLKDGAVVTGPQMSLQQDSQNGLYDASAILELTPDFADANASFSCRVRHKSLDSPLEENFQLQLQAFPSLQVFTTVSGSTLEMLACLANGFYPQDVHVGWLRNRVMQPPIGSPPQRLPNGTFSSWSMIQPQEMDPKVSYVCQVQHEIWDSPLELAAHWQPKGETVAVWSWLVFGIGLALCFTSGIFLYRAKKRRNMSHPETQNKNRLSSESAGLPLKPATDNTLM
ncbi:natural cytotoxicity triggering receptor 3 ligand 1-like isoform X2 [Sphaerodactylus townsendi]|uniref:Uncharacterized protein n=1 Tax=Sphaerodactylus townsendi TaxID=933632 RepID=A0ACB8EVF9_9SAUR|nr:natural cytotoxicity triggering receptor 3 ligand 1-like isoform X2 [Sphaerodactylus townsendi]